MSENSDGSGESTVSAPADGVATTALPSVINAADARAMATLPLGFGTYKRPFVSTRPFRFADRQQKTGGEDRLRSAYNDNSARVW